MAPSQQAAPNPVTVWRRVSVTVTVMVAAWLAATVASAMAEAKSFFIECYQKMIAAKVGIIFHTSKLLLLFLWFLKGKMLQNLQKSYQWAVKVWQFKNILLILHNYS
jgi:hypothetical protein